MKSIFKQPLLRKQFKSFRTPYFSKPTSISEADDLIENTSTATCYLLKQRDTWKDGRNPRTPHIGTRFLFGHWKSRLEKVHLAIF